MITDPWWTVIKMVNEVKPDAHRFPVLPDELTIAFMPKKGTKYKTAAEYQQKRLHKINLWRVLLRCVRIL